MAPHANPDEYYVDENDKWIVHYIISEAKKGFPDNYNETVQLIKNGELVGETIWQKDRYGNIKKRLQKMGIPFVPECAKRIMHSTP